MKRLGESESEYHYIDGEMMVRDFVCLGDEMPSYRKYAMKFQTRETSVALKDWFWFFFPLGFAATKSKCETKHKHTQKRRERHIDEKNEYHIGKNSSVNRAMKS